MTRLVNGDASQHSNAYLPLKKSHEKQVFHDHGQPQASISFFEIDDLEEMANRVEAARGTCGRTAFDRWKYAPAGL